MGVIRKWVFPILRLLVFAAVAVALVKIAFFADTTTLTNPDVPTATIVEPQVKVTLGSIKNDVTLTGSVAADAAVPVKVTLAGEVRKLLVAEGAHVEVGTPILTVRADVPALDGTVTSKTTTITAPVAGTLSNLAALVGQVFAVGETVGQVAPPTFHVSGALAADQLYRLLNKPTEAQVTITGGPAPFTCGSLTITAPLAGESAGPGSAEVAGAPDGPTVRCAVPVEVTVFSGLAATMVISGGAAENVLTVPTTAVEGTALTGNVYVVLPDDATEKRPVTLGLADGKNVQVLTGLVEGDPILQFVPGAPAVDPNMPANCTAGPGGSVSCVDSPK